MLDNIVTFDLFWTTSAELWEQSFKEHKKLFKDNASTSFTSHHYKLT